MLVNIHVINPGNRNLVYLMLLSAIYYAIKEIIIFLNVGRSSKTNKNDSFSVKIRKKLIFNS